MLEPNFQFSESSFRPIVLDAIPREMQTMAMNTGLMGDFQVIFAVFVEADPGSRVDREQTASPVPWWFAQEEHFGQFV